MSIASKLVPETRYYLGFNLVPGVGPLRIQRLIERCGSPAAAWSASLSDMHAAGFDTRSCQGLLNAQRTLDLDLALPNVVQAGLLPLCVSSPAYPALLAEIPTAPPLIYVRGALEPADGWAVAIVGTRQPTINGRDTAYRIAYDLARHGVTIVSGLALGIDTAAHQGALDGGGRTLAILACGAEQVYPYRNKALAAKIAEQGAIISDYPLGTKPIALNFPPRNRIISGLSLATLVIEAGEQSGALLTVDFALDQGREVFAVPGSIFADTSSGCNRLIREGATLVRHADDILQGLNIGRSEAQREARSELPIEPLEAQLLDVLDYEPRHVDAIGRACGLPASDVASGLTMLELKGLVRQPAPLLYVRR